ncbi:MAG: hypothetical protein HY232_08205 [Acidobacteria bacterium]|nr:hypothetical protein [Acidobacteriota bacterium]
MEEIIEAITHRANRPDHGLAGIRQHPPNIIKPSKLSDGFGDQTYLLQV